MTGEMSQSEVTRENFPELFALRDALKRRGIESTPRAFDQYRGPYLSVPGLGDVWYSQDADASGVFLPSLKPMYAGGLFVIEAGRYGFQAYGAHHQHRETNGAYKYGCYTLRQAARHIESIVGRQH